MELTLKRLLEHAEFKMYRKGYDPAEVDAFLDRAAAMAGKVEVQLTQALEKAKAADGGESPDPAAIEAEVEKRVAERIAQIPSGSSGPSEEEIAAEAQRTLVMAQRTADAAVREARDDADKLLTAAQEQSATLLADAEARSAAINTESTERAAAIRAEVEEEAARERREARQRLAAEVAELEGVRETLRSDVNVLERHVEEQRSQLGSTLAELQQILDDPSGFRMAPAPALADPALPDFSDVDSDVAVGEEQAPITEGSAVDASSSEPDVAVVELTEDREPEAEPAEPTPLAEAAPTPQPLTFEEVDHEAPGLDDPADSGPPTAPVSVIDLDMEAAPSGSTGDQDDPFLAELRKAMADDEPLGPRDDQEHPPSGALFEDDDRRGWRFGRRN